MSIREALKSLYIDKQKVKLPEWGGCWVVDTDGMLMNSDGSITEASRIAMYANREDFYIVQ